jgi:hypothetical protein
MVITREWGERGYYLVEMGIGSDPWVYERLYEKWGKKAEYDKLHLYEWRNPGDADYNSVIRPKDLVLWKPWIARMRPAGDPHSTYHGAVVGIAFDKTAQNKAAIDVLKGRGYDQVGYGGNFGL